MQNLNFGGMVLLASQLYSDGIKHIWIDGGVTISQFLDLETVDSMTLSNLTAVVSLGLPIDVLKLS